VCDETATARDPAPADAREGLGRDGIRTLRFALAITWAVSRLGHLPLNETDTYSKNGKFLSGASDARVRGTDHTMAHRHGPDTHSFFDRELDE
jgi:hypothetical protein